MLKSVKRCETMPMPERQEETNAILFDRLDGCNNRISALEIFKEVTTHRLENGDRRHDEICGQLVRTETKIMERLKTQGDVIDDLHNDKLRSEGAKSQWKLIFASIGVIYTIMQVAMLVMVVVNTQGQ